MSPRRASSDLRLYVKTRITSLVIFCLVLSFTPAVFAAGSTTKPTDRSWYDTSLPVPVLHVAGSQEDAAKAHAVITRQNPNGLATLSFFSGAIDRILKSISIARKIDLIGSLLSWANYFFITDSMVEHISDSDLAAYRIFAAEAGISEKAIMNALVVPDAGLWLLSLLHDVEKSPVGLTADFGCSSIIWNSGANSVLHARNLDYSGVGLWEKSPLILHIVPDKGLAHIAVTTLGIHTPGITAFNEAGLTLSIHQLTTDDTDRRGAPLAIISAKVISEAKNIDDAIKIIGSFDRAGGWAYVLSKDNDRAVIETTANNMNIRRSSQSFFYQTNHVSDKIIGTREIFASPGSWLDSHQRADRLAVLAKRYGKTRATPQKIAELITDRRRPDESQTLGGGTIARTDNIQSVIFDASKKRLFVGLADDMLSSQEHKYVELRWDNLRSNSKPLVGPEIRMKPDTHHLELRQLIRSAITFRTFDTRQADQNRLEIMRKFTRRAQESGVTDGIWAGTIMHAALELKLQLPDMDIERIVQTIDRTLRDNDLAQKNEYNLHRLALLNLLKGRFLDIQGKRDLALLSYKAGLETAHFDRVRKQLTKATEKPYSASDAHNLTLDWAGFDLAHY